MHPARALIRSAIAASLCGVVACSGGGPPGPDRSSATPTAAPVEPIAGLTWADDKRHDLIAGLTVGPCPGGGTAPLRCVSRGDKEITAFELLRYPVRTIEVLRNAAGTDVVLGLHAIAQDAYNTFEKDRAEGCGTGRLTFTGPKLTDQPVAGRDGLHWWYSLSRKGAIDEVVDSWATVLGADLVVIRYAGYGPHPCVPPEGTAYDQAVLTRLRPTLAAAVAGATL